MAVRLSNGGGDGALGAAGVVTGGGDAERAGAGEGGGMDGGVAGGGEGLDGTMGGGEGVHLHRTARTSAQ